MEKQVKAKSGRVSGDRLGALLDAAVDPVVLIDAAGRVTAFNRAAEAAFGYKAAEVLGQNVSMLMPAPHRERHDRYIERYLATRDPHIIGIGREVTALRKDGSTFPIELAVGEFRRGKEHGFAGFLRDLTAQKRQQAQILKTSDELRLIFDNTPTAITITDGEGHILKANLASESLLGYAPAELAGRLHADLVLEDDRAAVEEGFAGLRTQADEFEREVRYRTRGGRTLHTVLRAGIVRDDSGAPPMIICEIVDRSALFQATREVEELRDKLTHAGRIGILGEMVSSIAHEVNQPLTAIANYASAARRFVLGGAYDPQELAVLLDKIATQAERAGKVIRGVRSLTRKRDAVREPLDCTALIHEALRLVDFEFRIKGLRIVLRLSPKLPPVLGDGVQIQQVLLNLIRNAIEAMGEAASGDFVELKAAAREGWVEISVSDCGPGLNADAQARLFEPFFSTKAQGMGLGLSICKSIMAAHGGALEYRHNQRGGAEFLMRLPVASE
ncbi:MAG: PAS domain S-box protein [Nevskia sp.]|nr:PAS domain S-box protein [Nevskia sp.]